MWYWVIGIGIGIYLGWRPIQQTISNKLRKLILSTIQDSEILEQVRSSVSHVLINTLNDPEIHSNCREFLVNLSNDSIVISSISNMIRQTLQDPNLIQVVLDLMDDPDFREQTLQWILWYLRNGETNREVQLALIDLCNQPNIQKAIQDLLIVELEDPNTYETIKALLIRLMESPTIRMKLSNALYSTVIQSVTPRWLSRENPDPPPRIILPQILEGMSEEITEDIMQHEIERLITDQVNQIDPMDLKDLNDHYSKNQNPTIP